MRLEILHLSGPVPVKRSGSIDLAELPSRARQAVEAALHGALAARARAGDRPVRPGSSAPLPDVGSSTIRVVADDGTTTELAFSDADATSDEAALLRAVRPFLKLEPWVPRARA